MAQTEVWRGKRLCPACHRLKSIGWEVAEPDADGQCSFTEADRASVAASAAKAVQSIRARGPDMRPLPDTG